MIVIEDDMRGSFQTTLRMCRLATETGEPVQCRVLGKDVVAQPRDNPHAKYKEWFPEMSGGK